MLKGIRGLHPTIEKQAKPLQLEQLEIVDAWLTLTGATQGLLFSRINRWGRLSEAPMNPGSITNF
jgi:hypothetical protein